MQTGQNTGRLRSGSYKKLWVTEVLGSNASMEELWVFIICFFGWWCKRCKLFSINQKLYTPWKKDGHTSITTVQETQMSRLTEETMVSVLWLTDTVTFQSCSLERKVVQIQSRWDLRMPTRCDGMMGEKTVLSFQHSHTSIRRQWHHFMS